MTEPLPTDASLLAESFQHYGVDFRIIRLNPLDAHYVTEYIRPELLSAQLSGSGVGLSSFFSNPAVLGMLVEDAQDFSPELITSMAGLVDVVLNLEPRIIERIRVDLFNSVMFRRSNMSDYEKLLGNENDCFAEMRRGAIYTLIVRAFMVNFSDFIPEMLSLIPGLKSLNPSNSKQSEP